MSRFALVCGLLAPPLLFGQLTSNSVTVTASQTVNSQPTQAMFDVVVTSGLDKNLDDIVAALQGSDITAANFVGLIALSAGPVVVVNPAPPTPPTAPAQLRWNFQIAVPLAKLRDTSAAFAALAQSLQQKSDGLSLTVSVSTSFAPQQPSNCNLSDLIADARSQAQQLTSAAGVMAGMVQAITTSTPGSCFLAVRFALGTQIMPLQPNSITVTASRSTPLQPDQISIGLNVASDVNASLDDITSALQQAGISGAVFTGVNTTFQYDGNPPAQARLAWSFTLAAPVSKIKDTFSAILAGQQGLAKASPPLSLSFFGAQVQVSPELAKSQSCPEADLVKEAQAQAQRVAAAAGVSTGSILSLNGGSTAFAPAARVGDFSSFVGGFAFSTTSVLGLVPGFTLGTTCSMSVSFQLLQQ